MTGEPSSSLTSERSDEVGLFDIVVNEETRERPKWKSEVSTFTADRGEYKNETYLLAILPHILNT
jgi:hypothetical protein